MEDFPFTNADAGVAALVGLVTVMTAEVLYRAVVGYCDFIDGKEAETFAIEMFVSLLACISTCFGKTILA